MKTIGKNLGEVTAFIKVNGNTNKHTSPGVYLMDIKLNTITLSNGKSLNVYQTSGGAGVLVNDLSKALHGGHQFDGVLLIAVDDTSGQRLNLNQRQVKTLSTVGVNVAQGRKMAPTLILLQALDKLPEHTSYTNEALIPEIAQKIREVI